MTTAVAGAVAALERDEHALALSLALEAWRACRDPEIAAAIEELSRALRSESLAPLRTARERWAALEARARVDAPGDFEMLAMVEFPRSLDAAIAWLRVLASRAPDPRFAGLLHRLILAPPFGQPVFWRVVFELVAAAGDPRSVSFLERLEPRLREVARPSAHPAAERARSGALDSLRATYPSMPEPAVQQPALHRLKELLRARQAQAGANTAVGTQLLAAIRAVPEDDRARLVYADWLQERGDPRGELLALQLRGDMGPVAARRAQALIAEYGPTWMGSLASVAVASKAIFTRGFPTTLGVNARTEAMLEAVVGAPEWFSVEELAFTGAQAERRACAAIVTHPVMRSLRVVRGLGIVPASIVAASSPPLPLVTLGIADLQSAVTDEIAICEGLPQLQRIELVRTAWVRGADDLLQLAEAPVARRLRAIALTIGATTFELGFLAHGQRSLRIMLRQFDRKQPVARMTDSDEADRTDLAELAGELAMLTEVEIVVAAPLPDAFDPWLEQLLGDLAGLPRRITYAG